MVRRITEREEELSKIYRPYLYSPDGYHQRIREDAPQKAKNAYQEFLDIVNEAYIYELGFDPKKTAK